MRYFKPNLQVFAVIKLPWSYFSLLAYDVVPCFLLHIYVECNVVIIIWTQQYTKRFTLSQRFHDIRKIQIHLIVFSLTLQIIFEIANHSLLIFKNILITQQIHKHQLKYFDINYRRLIVYCTTLTNTTSANMLLISRCFLVFRGKHVRVERVHFCNSMEIYWQT